MTRRSSNKERVFLPTYAREWREYRRLTQVQAAEKVGIDPSNLSRLERGRTPYDQIILEQMAQVYECGVVDLLTRDPLRGSPDDVLSEKMKQLPPEKIKAALVVIEAMLNAK